MARFSDQSKAGHSLGGRATAEVQVPVLAKLLPRLPSPRPQPRRPVQGAQWVMSGLPCTLYHHPQLGLSGRGTPLQGGQVQDM